MRNKTDYSEFEGDVIDYFSPKGEHHKAKIAGCEYEVGLTVVDADSGDYLYCAHGPATKIGNKFFRTPERLRMHKILFLSAMAQIRKGRFDTRKDIELTGMLMNRHASGISKCGHKPSAEFCAFNQ